MKRQTLIKSILWATLIVSTILIDQKGIGRNNIWFLIPFASAAYLLGANDRKALAVILALSISFPDCVIAQQSSHSISNLQANHAFLQPDYQQTNKPEAVNVACGVLVIGFGVAVTISLIKLCEKLYKKKTNAPTEDELIFGGNAGLPGDAASDLNFCGYCPPDPTNDLKAVASGNKLITTTITISLFPTGPKITQLTVNPTNDLISLTELQQSWLNQGIDFNLFGPQYSKQGIPCQPWDSSIQIQQPRGLVPHIILYEGAGQMQSIVLERTEDFTTWTPIVTNTAPIGMTLVIDDQSNPIIGAYKTYLVNP